MKVHTLVLIFCVGILISMPVLAFTKSQAFIEATQQKEGKTGRVGVSAGQFAPKEPRFTKFVPPRIISGITVLTVDFANQSRNELRPIVTPVDEFMNQQKEQKIQEVTKEKDRGEETENVRRATLSVNSGRVTDQRLSAKKGSVLSLAIVLIGLIGWGIIKAASRKQE